VGVDAKTESGPAALRAVHAGGGLAGIFGGNVHVSRDVRVDGNLSASEIFMANADCAEDFDVFDAAGANAGAVMVLTDKGCVRASAFEYDRRVAGVVSGAGAYRPALVLDRHASEIARLPIALMGKVYCLVDATRYPVHVGDLLTTSSLPGHAMKATDPTRAFGAVIGKAMGDLEAGTGLVPVLVALQ
jgi:hypothetical protein